MRKAIIFIVLVFCCFLSAQSAWASKGLQHTGFGPIQEAMSGAGVAAPLDAHTIILNPAGIVKVPNRVDFSVGMGMPLIQMNTSAAPMGNAAAGNQKNQFEIFPLPFISTTFGFLDNRLGVGLSFIQNGGAAATYSQSRTNPGITGNLFDRHIDYRLYKVVPAIAYSILDNLHIGASVQLGYATLATDMLDTATGTENSGRSRVDQEFGVGGSFGFLYEPVPEFSFGFNYTSRMLFSKFDTYDQLLRNRRLDAPHQVQAGVAGRPFDWWLLCADFHWLNWSGVPVLGATPANGGLGWRDQYNVAFGTQFTIVDRVFLRLGYSWQTSAVRSDVVYANALVPLINEMNANAGVGVKINDNWNIDLGWGMAVSNSKTQTGGDAIGLAGAGTRSKYTGHVIVVGASYNWNE